MAIENTWCTVDTSPPWKPDWSDSRFHDVMRSYPTSYRLIESNSLIRLAPVDSLFAVVGPFSVFAAIIVFGGWCVLPASASRTQSITIVAFVAMATNAGLVGYRIWRGPPEDFLVFDRRSGILAIARYSIEFAIEDVIGFQWIEGRGHRQTGGSDTVNAADFNLLVKDRESIQRFHLVAMPKRTEMTILATLIQKPIFAISCWRRGLHRYMDRNGM